MARLTCCRTLLAWRKSRGSLSIEMAVQNAGDRIGEASAMREMRRVVVIDGHGDAIQSVNGVLNSLPCRR